MALRGAATDAARSARTRDDGVEEQVAPRAAVHCDSRHKLAACLQVAIGQPLPRLDAAAECSLVQPCNATESEAKEARGRWEELRMP